MLLLATCNLIISLLCIDVKDTCLYVAGHPSVPKCGPRTRSSGTISEDTPVKDTNKKVAGKDDASKKAIPTAPKMGTTKNASKEAILANAKATDQVVEQEHDEVPVQHSMSRVSDQQVVEQEHDEVHKQQEQVKVHEQDSDQLHEQEQVTVHEQHSHQLHEQEQVKVHEQDSHQLHEQEQVKVHEQDSHQLSIPGIDTIDIAEGHAQNVDTGADMATTHSKVDADALTDATPDAQLDACMNSLVDGGLGKDDFDLKVDCTVKVNMEYDMQMGAAIGHDTLVNEQTDDTIATNVCPKGASIDENMEFDMQKGAAIGHDALVNEQTDDTIATNVCPKDAATEENMEFDMPISATIGHDALVNEQTDDTIATNVCPKDAATDENMEFDMPISATIAHDALVNEQTDDTIATNVCPKDAATDENMEFDMPISATIAHDALVNEQTDAIVGDSRGKGTEVPTDRVAGSEEAVGTSDVADTNEPANVDSDDEAIINLFQRKERTKPLVVMPIKVMQPLSMSNEDEERSNRLCVILDMNGLLIQRCPVTYYRGKARSSVPTMAHFSYEVKNTPRDPGKRHYEFVVRPNVRHFLHALRQRTQIVLWSSMNLENLEVALTTCFPTLDRRVFLDILGQEWCRVADFKLNEVPGIPQTRDNRKEVFLKCLADLWNSYKQFNSDTTLLVDDTRYKSLLNPPGTWLCPPSFDPADTSQAPNYLHCTLFPWLLRWANSPSPGAYARMNQLENLSDTLSAHVISYYNSQQTTRRSH